MNNIRKIYVFKKMCWNMLVINTVFITLSYQLYMKIFLYINSEWYYLDIIYKILE